MTTGGGGGSTTKTEPWEGQKPFLEDIYGKAKDLNENAPIIPWQGDLVAPVNDLQMGAIDMAAGNAGVLNTASNQMLGSSNDIVSWAMQQAGARGTPGAQDFSATLAPGGGFSGGGERYTPTGFSSGVADYAATAFEGGEAGTVDYTPRGYTAGEYTDPTHTEFYLNPTENPSFMPGLEAALNPIYDKFLNEVNPQIGSAAEQAGAYGSSRHGVQTALGTQLMNRELADTSAKAVSDAYFKERAMLAERENLEKQLATNRFLGMEDLATRRYNTEEGLLASADEAEAGLASDRWKTTETLASNRWSTEKELETSRYMTEEQLRQRDIESAMARETERFVAGLDANTRMSLGLLQQDTALDTALMGLVPELGRMGQAGLTMAPSLLSTAGETLRGFDQQFLDEAITQYQNDQAAPYTNLKAYSDIIFGSGNTGSSSTTSTDGGGFNALSLIGPALMAGGMIFSSKEFKTPVGDSPAVLESLKKLPVELWKYHGSEKVHLGPYAEDFMEGVTGEKAQIIPIVTMLGALLKGVQELTARLEVLEGRAA